MATLKSVGKEIQNLDTEKLPAIGVSRLQSALEELKICATTDCRPPAEMAVKMESVGVTKGNGNIWTISLLGILAGFFIGLGAMFCTLVTTDIQIGFGLTKLLGGIVFCLGLILVVLAGAELFTGNVLMVASRASGKIKLSQLFTNWGIVYFANLIGSLLLVLVVFYSQFWALDGYKVGVNALSIANAKVSLAFWPAFARGILCNILVCLAVWLCFGARSTIDKIFAILFPITAFVACGFEHSIANMYFIPMGIAMAGQTKILEVAGVTTSQVAHLNIAGFIWNLVPVTLGNIVGGTFIGSIYWLIYLRRERTAEAVASRPWFANMFARPQLKPQRASYLDAETQALISVLARARDDNKFLAKLAENPNQALKAYSLTPEAKAALESGDVRWLESRVGMLDEPLRTWLTSRLSQEKW
ncbi:MAG: formate/nitrite transporter family protein [Chloroflexota bacterium]|nr:MAG: formate/nitrite transporter family protein [Chloroflexota bacterium]